MAKKSNVQVKVHYFDFVDAENRTRIFVPLGGGASVASMPGVTVSEVEDPQATAKQFADSRRSKHQDSGVKVEVVGEADEETETSETPETGSDDAESQGDEAKTEEGEGGSEGDDEDGDDDGDVASYDELTNDALREELKARNLSSSGNKKEMVARLEEDDAKASE